MLSRDIQGSRSTRPILEGKEKRKKKWTLK
jgi:hypothetical protein